MIIIILLKNNKQKLIILAYKPVFYFKTKHFNIQQYYICKNILIYNNIISVIKYK